MRRLVKWNILLGRVVLCLTLMVFVLFVSYVKDVIIGVEVNILFCFTLLFLCTFRTFGTAVLSVNS